MSDNQPPSLDNHNLEQSDVPLAYRAVRGGLWLMAGSYWALGFGFVANILLTRLLTPEVYGEFVLAAFFYTLFQLRQKVGLNFAFAQQERITGRALGTYFVLDVLLGVGGLLLSLIVAPLLLWLGYAPAIVVIMLVLALISAVESLLGVFSATLERDLRFKPGSLIGSVALTLSYLPAFWLALTGKGELSLIAQVVTFSLGSLSLFALYAWRRMQPLRALRWRFDRQLAVGYLRFGGLAGAGNFAASMAQQTDNFLVGTFVGTTPLGFYDRAYRTMQWPSLLLNALLSRSALFTYARLRDDAERLQRTVSMLIWLSIGVTMPIALALLLSAPDLVLLVYGERWLPAAPIMRIMFLAAVLRPLWDNANALFVGSGRPLAALAISGIQLVGVLLLGALFGSWLGVEGVALAVGVAYVISLVVALRLLEGGIRVSLWSQIGAPALAAAAVVAIYVLANRLLPLNDAALAVRVAGKVIFAVVGYYALSFLLQPGETRSRVGYLRRLMLAQRLPAAQQQ
jgi:PST family polysaccharide transporter